MPLRLRRAVARGPGRARPRASSTSSTSATARITGRPSCPAASSSASRSRVRSGTEPRLLVADEPTGQLDSHRAQMVMTLLRRLVHERDVLAVVATHDPLLVEMADHLVELRDGEVVGEERRGRCGRVLVGHYGRPSGGHLGVRTATLRVPERLVEPPYGRSEPPGLRRHHRGEVRASCRHRFPFGSGRRQRRQLVPQQAVAVRSHAAGPPEQLGGVEDAERQLLARDEHDARASVDLDPLRPTLRRIAMTACEGRLVQHAYRRGRGMPHRPPNWRRPSQTGGHSAPRRRPTSSTRSSTAKRRPCG